MIESEAGRRGLMFRRCFVVAVALGAAGCTGGSSSVPGGGPGMGGNGGTVVSPPPKEFKPAPAGLRRLTVPQYQNSITDLLGASALPETMFEADTALSGFVSIGAARLAVSAQLTEQYETAAREIAGKVLKNTATRGALVGCVPAGMTDDTCTKQFLKTFGRRAWRRPLTDAELNAYADLVKTIQTGLKDFYGGLEHGLAGLLQSPNFLYRVEIGTVDPNDKTRVAFDDYELATRLSFFLWNTTPDDALLDAADAHKLTKADGFNEQMQRLLKSPRAAAAMKNFFTEYYRLAELDNLQQLPTLFPQRTETIGPAMREETARFMTAVAFGRNADFRTLFDSRVTYVNGELAKLYGVGGVTGADFVEVTLPDSGIRAGYLGQASFLALNAHADGTSPTHRGKFIQEMLRCQGVPPPPMAVPPLPEDTSTGKRTMRQKLEIHRQVEPCKTCHAVMDPMGLAYENFDAMGVYRTMDAGQVIDASGEIDGKKFSGPRELAAILRQDPEVGACAARNLFRYAMGHVEGSDGNEEPAIGLIVSAFQGAGYHFEALVRSVVTSPAFVYAAPPSDMSPGGAGGGGGVMDGGVMDGSDPDTGAGGAGGTAGSDGGTKPDTGPAGPPPVMSPTYAKDIAPILAARCQPCHTTQARAGLNFTYANLVTNGAATNGLTSGCGYLDTPRRRVVPGLPDQSFLWVKLVTTTGFLRASSCGDQMPLGAPNTVPTSELDTIHNWIKQGAKP